MKLKDNLNTVAVVASFVIIVLLLKLWPAKMAFMLPKHRFGHPAYDRMEGAWERLLVMPSLFLLVRLLMHLFLVLYHRCRRWLGWLSNHLKIRIVREKRNKK